MRQTYPSDITRKAFELIREDLESCRKTTKKRKVDLYDVFCAVLYLTKEGCTWSAIPHDFPNLNTVRYKIHIWKEADEETETSMLDKVLQKLVEAERAKNKRAAQTTMIIVDSKSIQNTNTAEEKGYDAGKKSPE